MGLAALVIDGFGRIQQATEAFCLEADFSKEDVENRFFADIFTLSTGELAPENALSEQEDQSFTLLYHRARPKLSQPYRWSVRKIALESQETPPQEDTDFVLILNKTPPLGSKLSPPLSADNRVQDRSDPGADDFIALMDLMPIGLALWDQEDRLRYANTALHGVLGQTFKALKIGASFLQVSEDIAASAFSDPATADIQVRRRLANHRNPGNSSRFQLENGRKVEVTDHRFADGSILSIYKDVTDAVEAKEKLENRFQRLSLAEDLLGLGLWEWNARLRTIEWSRPTFQMFGLDPDDAVPNAKKFLEIIHPDDREQVSQALEAMKEGRLAAHFIFRVLRDDQKIRLYHSQSHVEFGQNRAVNRVIGTFQDITTLVKASDTLGEREEFRLAMFDVAGDAILVTDQKGLCLKANQTACAFFGYRREALLKMTLFDLQQDLDQETLARLWADIPRDKAVTLGAFMKNHNGQSCPTEIRVRRFESQDGERFIAIIRDITHRLEQERRTVKAERRLQDAIENIADGLIVLDQQDQMLIMNHVWRAQTGLEDRPPLPIGTGFKTLLDGIWSKGTFQSLDPSDQDWRPKILDWLHKKEAPLQIACQDGRQLMLRAETLEDQHSLLILTDITAIKSREAELERLFKFRETLSSVSPTPVFAFDHSGHIAFVNPRLCALVDRPREYLTGQSACIIYDHFLYGEGWQADLANLSEQASGTKYQSETRFRNHNGQIIDVAVARSAYHDDDGNIIGVICVLTDISVIKKTERRFQDFANASSDWFWETDSDLFFTFASDSIEHHLGLKPSDLADQNLKSFFQKEGHASDTESYLDHLEHRRAFRDCHFQIPGDYGRDRVITVSGKPIFDSDESFIGYRGTVADRTAQLTIERALQKSERALRSVLDASNDSIILIDAHANVQLSNKASEKLYGVSSEEFIGQSFYYYLEPELRASFRMIIHSILQTGTPWHQEHERRGIWHEDLVYPILDEDNKVQALTLFSRNISDRRRHEVEIEQSIRRYRRLFEATEVVFLTVDLRHIRLRLDMFRTQGVRDLQKYLIHRPEILDEIIMSTQIKDMNNAAPRLFGLATHEEVREKLFDFFTASTRITFVELLQAFWEGKSQLHSECQLRTARGDYIHVQFSCPIPRDMEECAHVPLSLNNITEIKKTQRDLTHAKDLAEQANRAKSTFLANMSHELRTPLNAIIGFGEIIQGALLGNRIEDKYKEYAGDIVKGAHILMEIITEILDFARVEQHTYHVKPVQLNLVPLVMDMISLVRGPAENRGVKLQAGSLPSEAFAFADSRATKQILINLCTNATKFTPRDGSVTLDLLEQKDMWDLVITDTGIGIEEKDLERIFEPFVQVARETGDYHEGTGLGLPLCEKLAHLMQGTITVKSKVGHGSCFTLSLPKVSPKETS